MNYIVEDLYLIITEWYDGDTITKFDDENDKIEILQASPDHIIEEIKEKTPDHFQLINYDEPEIKKWIEDNRKSTTDIIDSIQIGETDTLDINQPDNHLNTLGGFSGTTYELWHEIKKPA